MSASKRAAAARGPNGPERPERAEAPRRGAPATAGNGRPVHLFTVDVEEYFQVAAFEPTISRADWGVLPARVHRATDRLLDLLASHGVTGTFFCLGWVAERNPDVIGRIAAAGHEIGSHGWSHRRVNELAAEGFRHEVRRSRELLAELSGQPVLGFRAPNFSIVPGAEWALDVLIEEGYRYDSSVFPVRRLGYGYPSAPTAPYWIRRAAGDLLELPPATLELARLRLPAAGGAYLRQLPYWLVRNAFRHADEEGESAVFYVHPWELDPDQPRLPVPLLAKMRHYGGLRRTEPRLERLLTEFHFAAVRDRFDLNGPTGEDPRRRAPEPLRARLEVAAEGRA